MADIDRETDPNAMVYSAAHREWPFVDDSHVPRSTCRRNNVPSNRRIPVLHLINTLEAGGAERQLITLLEAFDRDRFEHHVGVLSWGGFLADEVRADPSLRFVDFGFRHRHFFGSFGRVVRYLREHDVQVLHAHLHLVGLYGRVAARIARTPVAVYTEHSDVGDRPWYERLAERAVVPWTSMKITVSDEQRALTQRLEGFPADRVMTMSNSVPTSRFAPSMEGRARVRTRFGFDDAHVVVGIVGRIEERKRVPALLRVGAALVPRFADLRILVVGEGPGRDRAAGLAVQLGIADHVVFAGRQQDVAAMMQAMDVLAITSRWEGLPINLLEAMSTGLPVVATAVGDIPAVLAASGAGVSVATGDEEAFADALAELLTSPALRRERGDRARAHVLAHHDAALNCRRLESLYLDLLAQRREGASARSAASPADSA